MINNNHNKGGTAYNRAYLASCLRHFAQILPRRTSDTLGTSDCVKTPWNQNMPKSFSLFGVVMHYNLASNN